MIYYITAACLLLACMLSEGDTSIIVNVLLPPPQNSSYIEPCVWRPKSSFSEYMNCVKTRVKRQYDYHDPYGPYTQPCQHYTIINQPERRVGNIINKLTDSALCDRAFYRRWYRFDSAAGGVMPEQCVEEFHCGTHAPIWLNGDYILTFNCGTHAPIWLNGAHPTTYNQPQDVEVCVSLAGECCRRRWYVRITNCGDFYTYLLPDTPGCYMAYCIGDEFPCPPGTSSPTGFSPGCSENFPKLTGEVSLSVDKEGTDIVFYCDYSGPIPSASLLEYMWYVSEPEDRGTQMVWQETVAEQRRSKLPEHRWMGKMGSNVYCKVRAMWESRTGVPSPAIESKKYFAGLLIKQRVVSVSEHEEETEIEVQSTVPITCLPQFSEACKLSIQVAHDQAYAAKKCVDRKMRQVVFGECSLDIEADNWWETKKLKVKAVRDFYHDGNKRMLVDFKPAYSTMLSPVWNNYQLPPVEVLTTDGPTAMCSSTGDPHYVTFDGMYYHVYLEGEFVLYKNTRYPLQINTLLERCGDVVTCNCAVAVMAADDVIVIDRCKRKNRNLAFGKSFPDGWRTLHRHALQQGDDFVKGLKIYEYDEGRRFTVHMPTGAYLEFQIGHEGKWIDMRLFASSDDWKSTLGLCGTFDGVVENEFTFRGGQGRTIPHEGAACGDDRDVCEFAENWRVEDKDSFFSDEVMVELQDHNFNTEHKFCKCEKQSDGTGAVTCNYHYDVDNCQAEEEQAKGKDKTMELLEKSRARQEAKARVAAKFGSSGFSSYDSHDQFGSSSSRDHFGSSSSLSTSRDPDSRSFRRRRRDVSNSNPILDQDDDDYFNSEFIFDKSYRGQEPSWPTPTGKTEVEARNFCAHTLLDSHVGIVCKHYIEKHFATLVHNCLTDIKVTDEYDWALSSLSLLTSECTEAVHKNATLWGIDPNDAGFIPTQTPIITTGNYSTTTTTVAPTTRPTTTAAPLQAENILDVLCPGACSARGRCHKGTCRCNRGYRGADCSEERLPLPRVLFLSGGGLCDLSKQPCHHVTVHGSNFRNSSGLKCIFQPVIRSEGYNTLLGAKMEVPARFETYEEVVCQLPEDDVTSEVDGAIYEAYHVKVANDLLHVSEPNIMVVHDSRCLNCSIQGLLHTCERLGDNCFVNGECYVRDERNPDNCCAACMPNISTNAFTTLKENHMPVMKPWRSTYNVGRGEDWQLNVIVSDPEGCPVFLNVDNQSPKHLQVNTEANTVHIKLLSSQRPGLFSVSIEATDSCGAVYQQNYHVVVDKSKRRH